MNRKTTAVAADDSDLDDLLAGGGGGGGGGGKPGDSTETAPLNLDHLTQGKLDVPRRQAQFNAMSYTDIVSAYCNYLCYRYPTLCLCLSLSFILLFVVILVNGTLNPTEEFGVIKQDFSDIGNHDINNIRSEFDSKMGKIDHWCLNGGNERCRCEDPLSPQSRAQFKTWVKMYKKNRDDIFSYKGSDFLDVAFLGESVVEEMDGRWMGKDDSEELKAIGKIFKKRFKKQNRVDNLEGVALGIAGDTTPNVLWRIMNGEMPDDFNPKVWWVSLGMNDLGRSQCSEEVVVIGILRVVEEIRIRKPNAHIVINSLLPMADLRGGLVPLDNDYRDAFRKSRGQRDPLPDSTRYVPKAPEASSEATQEASSEATPEVPDKKVKKPKGSSREVDRPPDEEGKESSRRLTEYDARNLKRRDRAESEQQEDDPELRRQQRLEAHHRMRRDPFNPLLNPYQHKMRKYDTHKLFLKKSRLPLWTSINAINEELRKFCETHKKISYFDATEVFAERADGGQYVLLSDRISVRGHPTVLGFQKWEEAIEKYLKKLLPKVKKDQPASQPAPAPKQPPKDETEQLNIRKVTTPPKKEEDNKGTTEDKKADDKKEEKSSEDKKKEEKSSEDKKKEKKDGKGEDDSNDEE